MSDLIVVLPVDPRVATGESPAPWTWNRHTLRLYCHHPESWEPDNERRMMMMLSSAAADDDVGLDGNSNV